MSASDTAVTITALGLRNDIPGGLPLADRLTFAMRKVREPNGPAFMCANDDQMFRGAVAAVLITCNAEERQRIELELQMLKALSAATSGIPVNFASLEMPADPIGLLRLWHASKEEPAK